MERVNDKLFVYGTLLGDIDSNIARFLRRNSSFLGEYRVRGQMYDLGFYPGLVLTPAQDEWVSGHLLQLRNAALTLITLDDYEGIAPGQEQTGTYRRQLAEIYREDRIERAWIYVYNEPVDDLPLIPFSNYLDYLRINDAHQKFIQSV